LRLDASLKNKGGQLKDKRRLFLDYCADVYGGREDIVWMPQVYRALAHYAPNRRVRLRVDREIDPDVALVYTTIPQGLLEQLSEDEKEEIYQMVHRRTRMELDRILSDHDAAHLHDLIVRQGQNPNMSDLRGKMAEILVQKDIENAMPGGMKLYRNGDIRYFSRKFNNGTEVDGILTFYGEQPYMRLIENLKELAHLEVRSRWDRAIVGNPS